MLKLRRNLDLSWYAALIPIIVILVLGVLGFDGLYGQDSYEYLRYSNRLREFMQGEEYPGDLFWPKGYLILVAGLSFIFSTALAGQLVSIICLYGSYFFFVELVKELYPSYKFARIYSILAFLIAPYILRLGTIVMSDTLAILCLLGTAYFALRYSITKSTKYLFWACFFSSFGAFSRYAVIIPLLPIVSWVIFVWIKKPKWKQIFVLIIPIGLFFVHSYLDGQGSDFLNHHFIENWRVENIFKRNFITAEELQIPNESYLLPNLVYNLAMYLYPGFFFLIGISFLVSLKNLWYHVKSFPLAFTLSVLFYSIFLSGITYQSSRYLALAYPIFALFAYPSYEGLILKIKPNYRKLVVWSLVLAQLLLFCRAMYPTFKLNKLERELSLQLEPYENKVIYSFDVDIGLKQRNTNLQFKNLWIKEYKEFKSGALVLFNEPQIAAKFSGKNPMVNWNKLNETKNLELIKQLPQGWNLYQINE